MHYISEHKYRTGCMASEETDLLFMVLRSAGRFWSWLQARLSRTKLMSRAKLVGMSVRWLLDTSWRLKKKRKRKRLEIELFKMSHEYDYCKVNYWQNIKMRWLTSSGSTWQECEWKKQFSHDWGITQDLVFLTIFGKPRAKLGFKQGNRKPKTHHVLTETDNLHKSLEHAQSSVTLDIEGFSQQ